MNKIATIAAIILFALLFLSCEEKQELAEDNPKVLEAKLKKEYKKKFGVPISDFELSVTGVEYSYNEFDDFLDLSITRTATGATAKYMIKHYGPEYELKLDTQEWLDFVYALHICIKVTGERDTIKYNVLYPDIGGRNLKISFSSPKEIRQYHVYNKTEIVKVMNFMIEGIKKRTAADIAASTKVLETNLKEEYEKKIGVPISDFELSVENIEYYRDLSGYGEYSTEISITRTANGAIARYMKYSIHGPEYELKLNTQEWLDFVNALNKCKVKGKKNTHKTNRIFTSLEHYNKSYLKIWLSSQEELGSFLGEYHLDSAKTLKVMEAMDAKIKKSVVANLAASIEPKLKEEYEKRFGVPISDFELSISRVDFDKPDFWFRAYRTAKGVSIICMDYNNKRRPEPMFISELDIDDWLDFINALNKCNVNKWKWYYENLDKNLKRSPGTWRFNIEFLDKRNLYFVGAGGYPPNWDEFMKVMDDFKAKIIEKGTFTDTRDGKTYKTQ